LWENRGVRARVVVLACLLALVPAPAVFAQRRATFEIAPFIGYRFGGSVTDYYYGQSHSINASQSEGLIVSVPIRYADSVELLFSRQSTNVDVGTITGTKRYPLTINYWMLGSVHEFTAQSERVHPFLAAYLGIADLSTSQGSITSASRFSAAIGGGAKFDLGRRVGIRLDARAHYVFVSTSGGMFCGGGGCSASFSGSGLLQGEGTASLVIKL